MIKSFKDLKVYQKAYAFAMEVFLITRKFPKEEIYSLSSQIIRSSRSVAANISEGWARRSYENVFKQFLITALGSASETQTWLDFAKDCQYISSEEHRRLSKEIDEIGKMITQLHKKWKNHS
ncbi:MAG: four helix bundle protein [Bacteroidota bacterium]